MTPPEQDLLYEDSVPTRDRLTNEQLRSHDVYIGRGCEKLGLSRSEWCNPFHITKGQSRTVVLQKFSVYARKHLAHKVHRLAGCRLLCHCGASQNCHGDVLIHLYKETCCPRTSPKRPPCVEGISVVIFWDYTGRVSAHIELATSGRMRRRADSLCWSSSPKFDQRLAGKRASELNVPWLVGLPAERPGKSHMLLLDEWSLPMSAIVERICFDQCQFGSADKKPTLLFGTLPVALKASPSILNTGESNVRDGTEPMCSEGYPAELCKQLAHKIWLAAVSRRTDVLRSACKTTLARTSRPGKAHLPCQRVSSDNPCRALFTPRASEAQNLACLACGHADEFDTACQHLAHEVR